MVSVCLAITYSFLCEEHTICYNNGSKKIWSSRILQEYHYGDIRVAWWLLVFLWMGVYLELKGDSYNQWLRPDLFLFFIFYFSGSLQSEWCIWCTMTSMHLSEILRFYVKIVERLRRTCGNWLAAYNSSHNLIS